MLSGTENPSFIFVFVLIGLSVQESESFPNRLGVLCAAGTYLQLSSWD